MSKVSVKAVLIGGIVDIGSSAILGIPLGVVVVSRLDLTRIPKDQIGQAMKAAFNSVPLRAAEMLIGLLCSVLGGYIAAWLAKHDELLNGALSSCLCAAIGVYSIVSGKGSHSLLVQLLMLVSAPAFALIGGYLRLRQRAGSGELATTRP